MTRKEANELDQTTSIYRNMCPDYYKDKTLPPVVDGLARDAGIRLEPDTTNLNSLTLSIAEAMLQIKEQEEGGLEQGCSNCSSHQTDLIR